MTLSGPINKSLHHLKKNIKALEVLTTTQEQDQGKTTKPATETIQQI